MARALPAGVTMVGGTSARRDFASTEPSFQFCADRVSEDGVAVLLFSGPIAHSMAVGTGWRTLGATGTVTRADGRAPRDRRPAGDRVPRPLSRCHRPGVVREPAGRRRGRRGRVVPPGDPGDRSCLGFGHPGRLDPGRRHGPADDRRHGRDPGRAGAALRGRRRTSRPAHARGRPDLLVRRQAVPARVADRCRGRARTDRARPVDADGWHVLLRRDRPGPGSASSRFLNETFVTLLLGT